MNNSKFVFFKKNVLWFYFRPRVIVVNLIVFFIFNLCVLENSWYFLLVSIYLIFMAFISVNLLLKVKQCIAFEDILFVNGNPNKACAIYDELKKFRPTDDRIETIYHISLFHLGNFKEIENRTRKFNVYHDSGIELATCLYLECVAAILSKDIDHYNLKRKELNRINVMTRYANKKRMVKLLQEYLNNLNLLYKLFINKEYVSDIITNDNYSTEIDRLLSIYVYGINELNNHDYKKAKRYFDMIKDENKDLFYVVDSNILLEFINNECLK